MNCFIYLALMYGSENLALQRRSRCNEVLATSELKKDLAR